MKLDKLQIKKTIQTEIEKISKKIEELEELTKPISPDCAIGRVSRMDAINNKAINENLLSNAKFKLKRLEVAFQNVDDASFGVCARCQQQIPIGRIVLMPQSPFCVQCIE